MNPKGLSPAQNIVQIGLPKGIHGFFASEKSILSEAFGFTLLISLSLTLFPLQRACYLSISAQKDETLETEKAQYYLPDGSTIEVCKDHPQRIPNVKHRVSRIAFCLVMGNLMRC